MRGKLRILTGVLCLLLLIVLLFPASYSVSTSSGASRVRIFVDRTRVFSRFACVNVSWDVVGIREIYLNELGVTGSGATVICDSAAPVTFRILTQTGETLTYSTNILSFENNGWFWLFCLVMLGSIIIAEHQPISVYAARAVNRLRIASRWLLDRPAWAVALLTLIGAGLRLYHLTFESLWFDEVMLVHIAQVPTLTRVTEMNSVANSAPPLFAWSLSAVLHLGNSEAMLRAISLAAGVVAIPMMYALARQIVSRQSAYFCALLFTVATTQIRYAQEVREYALVALLTIGILLTFTAYRRSRTARNSVLLVVVWSVSIFTQYGLALVIASLNIVFFIDWLRSQDRRIRALTIWICLQAIVFVSVVIVYFTTLRFQFTAGGFAGTGYLASSYGDGTLGSLVNLIIKSTREIIEFTFPGDIFFLLTLIGGAAVISQRRYRDAGITIVWVLFPLTIVAAFLRFYPYHGARQNIFLTIPLLLVAAIGYEWLAEGLRWRRLHGLIAAVLVIGGTAAALTTANTPSARQTRQAMAYIEQHYQPADRIYVHSYTQLVYEYYRTQGLMAGLPDPLIGISPHMEGYLSDIPGLLTHDGRIWMLIAECSNVCSREHSERIGIGSSFSWEIDTGDTALFLIVPTDAT
ncbi:MAG: glycosyltransferase family 39 protein [Chloroflexota bacterium]|nr:glycosyltransferase family 39 protein [Chloroflexota bacterium]